MAEPSPSEQSTPDPSTPDPSKPDPSPKKAPKAKHTSVIYVHGIGSQRRYEETSRLIDSLDMYLTHQVGAGTPQGLIRGIDPVIEPLRADRGGTISYIESRLIDAPEAASPKVRFYEIYWAPVMAEQKSPWRIVKWMFSQVVRPYRTLMTPWRDRQRLRRAALVALYEQQLKSGTLKDPLDFQYLLKRYDEFEDIPALTSHPKGSFPEFLTFIGEDKKQPADRVVACRALAQDWLASYRRNEFANAIALVTVALTLALVALAVPMVVQTVLRWLVTVDFIKSLLGKFNIGPAFDLSTAVSASLALASVAGVGKMLSDYMGDVESWATYEETDEKHVARNKVMDQSLEVMTHVLNDPDCDRVAVVSHSLGTSIAHDALLSLTRRNRGSGVREQDVMKKPVPLEKIEHFITMGSPIDKIEYFFESYASASHRYKRVVETLRGDIGTAPFTKNRKPHVHWINFWDAGDQISGALQSPASAEMTLNRVDNQQVASYHFPTTAASHSGYFTHRTVIATIFQAVYLREHSFRTLIQPAPDQPYPYENTYLTLPVHPDNRIWFLRAALLFPWLAGLGIVLKLVGIHALSGAAFWAAAGIVVGLFLCSMASKSLGHRNPI